MEAVGGDCGFKQREIREAEVIYLPTTCWALLSYSSHIMCSGGCICGHVPTYLLIYYGYFCALFHGVVLFFVPLITLRRPVGKSMGLSCPNQRVIFKK